MTDAFDRAVQRESSIRHRRRAQPCWHALFLHARIYVAVNALLAVIWAIEWVFGEREGLWFLSVLYGWGIGLAIHYVVVTQIVRQWWPGRPPRGDEA